MLFNCYLGTSFESICYNIPFIKPANKMRQLNSFLEELIATIFGKPLQPIPIPVRTGR